MSWQDDTRNILRTVCGDVGPTYEYDDSRLDELILYSAKIVLIESLLNDTYTLDLSAGTISPDPSSDDWLLTLLALKSWEILAKNEYRIASNKAMSLRDGPSSVDGRGIAENKKVIAEEAIARYREVLVKYNSSTYSAGKAVLSPFRVQSDGESEVFFH